MWLVGLIAAGSVLTVTAQDTNTGKAAVTETVKPVKTDKAATKGLPIKGTVASVDKVAKTVTLEGPKKHLLHVTSQTKITKDGKPAIFDDIAAGEKITGYQRGTEDKWDAISLKLSPGKAASEKQTATDKTVK